MKKHKLTYVGVLYCGEEPVILAQSFNFSELPYFSRSQAKNLSVFTAREISKRVDEGFTGTTIEEYAIYAHKWENGMCILCICDKEYPSRTAFALIQHSFFIFNEKYIYEELDLTKDNNLSLPELKELLLKYRAPEQVDMYENVFGKVQNTKNIVTKTVKELLNNEESLEALVNQSKDLSAKTKDVFAKSKKLKRRSCCALM
ncbi:uncharacterized protein TOT_020000949 [Theileria orientalis strain Shintoku]|uniref:Longin domain-containing protein n=1 Tax=Theileria orientalis strain Shintoku TaxID=869250 RepID=J4D8B7_THEOR|nr:uncharacterized protein TOT_020000949 [Theileria orientalis strain Shintoku]BAM40695.1 uncharacterized protein TOT_020000949 [Theileria orientalis strain Shintoku]|eukprot:XP_009690996.1 uncharacterized protein TOT_020000949 [Theileria orientalis strain Shintoku]